MIIGIHHTAISVPDIEKAIEFYSGVLGFEVVEEGEWEQGNPTINAILNVGDCAAKQRMLKAPNAYIELFEYKTPKGADQDANRPVCDHGYTHFCLQVTDIQSEYERLQNAGMRFHAPPQNMETCHATYGRDPFGNVIEIYEIFSDVHPGLPGSH